MHKVISRNSDAAWIYGCHMESGNQLMIAQGYESMRYLTPPTYRNIRTS